MMYMLQKINNQIKHFEKNDLLLKRWESKPWSQTFYKAMYTKYPLNEKYFFELNPSFVYEYQSIDTMATLPFVMLRDGFFGLFYLFLKYPKLPEKTDTVFLIPSKFSYLIPKKWKDNILIYDFEYTKKNEHKNKSIIYGNISQENFINKTVEEKFHNIFPKAKENILVSTFREYGFLQSHNESALNLEFQKSLYKNLGFDVKRYNTYREEIFSFVDDSYSYFNIDSDHFLIYDDYLNHFFASKGALNINNLKHNREMEQIKILNLSPYHKIKIGRPKSFSEEIFEQQIEIKLKKIPLNPTSPIFFEYAIEYYKGKLQKLF